MQAHSSRSRKRRQETRDLLDRDESAHRYGVLQRMKAQSSGENSELDCNYIYFFLFLNIHQLALWRSG